MGGVGTAVKQMRVWNRIINCYPDLIAFFQVQRRLEGQRTELRNGGVKLVNMTRPDYIPVQIKIRMKMIIRRWRKKTRHSREREKISSRSRGCEFPRCQIHGVSLVHQRQVERNWSWRFVEWRISLGVEMDGRRFDVDISNPFLFVCIKNKDLDELRWTNEIKTRRRTILIRKKVTINHFHLLRSFDRKKSAQFVSHLLQIPAGGWHFTNVDYFTRSGFQKWNFSFLS